MASSHLGCQVLSERLQSNYISKENERQTFEQLNSNSISMSSSDEKDEYIDLSSNLRHYSNIRFAGLTIFLAVTAVLINFVFAANLSTVANLLFKIGGFFLTLLFLLVDISDMYLWTRFIKRAAKLEKSLDYKQYSSLPGAPEFIKFRPATTGNLGLLCTLTDILVSYNNLEL